MLVPAVYPRGCSPSQRFRIEQWIPYLREYGIEVDLVEGMRLSEYWFYRRYWWVGMRVVMGQVVRRLWDWLRSGHYDLIWIQREVSLLPDWFLEKLFFRSGRPVLFDFDDALWMEAPASRWSRHQKVWQCVREATHVVVCNSYLSRFVRVLGRCATVLPTVIDTDVYGYEPVGGRGGPLVLGWIGSTATFQHNFLPFIDVWRRIRRELGSRVEFFVMSPDRPKGLEALGWRWWRYHMKKEKWFLRGIHVGLMPLPSSPWMLGKCAFKLLQYMAVGRPVVASPVGMNLQVVCPGQTGWWAHTEEDWLAVIDWFLRHSDRIGVMGRVAREHVVRQYSVRAWLPVLVRVLRSVIEGESIIV